MKNIIKNLSAALILSCFSIFSCITNAANENHTLHVYITNETHDELQFERVEGGNPGNNFIISSPVIHSGESSIITVEKLLNNDIAGKIVFSNLAGIEANLVILDQEQVHMGQPIFHLSGTKHDSILVSKTRNKNVGPRYLTYVEANLRIVEKIG